MHDKKQSGEGFNRRDFIKSGSTATLMAMLGGVRLLAGENEASGSATKYLGPKVKVGIIGLGSRGREIINTLFIFPEVEIKSVCDTYPASVRRAATAAPGAVPTENYRTILSDPEIQAVVVATPTHQHKEIVLAALKAGKHVYCETPMAHTVEDAREIALAAKALPHLIFQPGLHLRSDPQRRELIRTFRTGALGKPVMARTQWHKKISWRAASPKPEREKELNWRLDKTLSLGLMGEILGQHMDQAMWFFGKIPVAISARGIIAFWEDGREVPDTVQATIDFPGGVFMNCDVTLANSFDGEYEVYYGSDSAVLLRQSDVWLFKEVDARLLGWEIYFPKEQFHKETGIVLKVGASKVSTQQETEEEKVRKTPLGSALTFFVRNAGDLVGAREDFISSFGDDPPALREHLATKVLRRPAPGFLEGYRAAVAAIKANEAVLTRQPVMLKPEWFELA